MEKKGSVSARTKPKVVKKKPVGLLDLPGEVRNMVYSHYFHQGFECNFAGKKAILGPPQRKSIKFCRPGNTSKDEQAAKNADGSSTKVSIVRFSRILGNYRRIDGIDTRWSTSLSPLIFVCKQVHTEIIPFLYESTTFGFDSPARVFNFLHVLSATNLANVTKVQLHYHVYGDPRKTEDVKWKQKHLDSWSRTCKAAAKQLVNLQQLDVWVHITNSDVWLNMHEPYLRPIFWFRKRQVGDKNHSQALQTASIHVRSRWNQPCCFWNRQLNDASNELHRLFGEAIGRVLLGASMEAAMVDFNDAWENKYAMWRHHLQFARTGW